ncbi:MAG: TolC family protein [Cyclobacteriaceae bacterium]|nr:TolC family protein [Cyclobacteriaceae bacterium]
MNYQSYKYRGQKKHIGLTLILSFLSCFLWAQSKDSIEMEEHITLEYCIQFALQNSPEIKNANLNEAFVETTIKSKLSEWYPQIGLTYNLQHNFQLPTTNFNGNISHLGSQNTSGVLLGLTQTIFNQDALLASQSAKDIRTASEQKTKDKKISLAVAVSKTFYNIILVEQQSWVVDEDIIRNSQSVKDAYYQYQSGIVDKTDYKRATIALNNSKAQKVFVEESLLAKKAYLKELMGYPNSRNIILAYDTTTMESQMFMDTTQSIDYGQRIEIQQLETQKRLQLDNLKYYKWSFLPNLFAFGNYNLNFLNNEFSNLYKVAYPNSFAGLGLSFPILQGGKRIQQIRGAQFLKRQVDNDILSYQYAINTQYQTALSNYKGNLNNFLSQKENLSIAKEVYEIIQLQYRSGVKTFLDVITAESDLKTAQINYYNSLYQVLSSKLDVEQALGNINY